MGRSLLATLTLKLQVNMTAREYRLCFSAKTVLKLPFGNMGNMGYVIERADVMDSVLVLSSTLFSCRREGKSEKIRSNFL
jgi:hypothetical protein